MDRFQREQEAQAARDQAQSSLDNFYKNHAGVIDTYHSLVNELCTATRAQNDELRKSYKIELKTSEPIQKERQSKSIYYGRL